jgi:hypothetical protein
VDAFWSLTLYEHTPEHQRFCNRCSDPTFPRLS